ncbi:MAG: transposase [Actinomycetota bacterium]|nr:transposase [Actinomycetota bacterium]
MEPPLIPGRFTLAELQALLDRFVAYYNALRPHRALERRTPQEAFDAKVKAHPTPRPSLTHFRVRRDKVDTTGRVSLRYQSRLHHIGVGRAHTGKAVQLLIADLDIRVVDLGTGEVLRTLRLDPTRDYQPLGSS